MTRHRPFAIAATLCLLGLFALDVARFAPDTQPERVYIGFADARAHASLLQPGRTPDQIALPGAGILLASALLLIGRRRR